MWSRVVVAPLATLSLSINDRESYLSIDEVLIPLFTGKSFKRQVFVLDEGISDNNPALANPGRGAVTHLHFIWNDAINDECTSNDQSTYPKVLSCKWNKRIPYCHAQARHSYITI